MGICSLVIVGAVLLAFHDNPLAQMTRQMQFIRVDLGTDLNYTNDKLMDDLDCGHICLADYPECKSYIYDVEEYTCYVANSPHKLKEMAEGLHAHLYAGCDLGRGFRFHTRHNTTACLSKLLPVRTYNMASRTCQKMGGYLASAKTLDKRMLLQTIMKGITGAIWVGLDDLEVEGEFVWEEDGSQYGPPEIVADTFQVPNTLTNCVIQKLWQLDDVGCAMELNFVCEMLISL